MSSSRVTSPCSVANCIVYVHANDYDKLTAVNIYPLKTIVAAIDAASPTLQHIILQTGRKVLLIKTLN